MVVELTMSQNNSPRESLRDEHCIRLFLHQRTISLILHICRCYLKLLPIFNAVAACPDIIAILLFIVQLYLIPSFEAARSTALYVPVLDTASGNSASWGYHLGLT